MRINSPQCGQSDRRNDAYNSQWSPGKFYTNLIKSKVPIIFDVGAHQGESAVFFKKIFPISILYSFEPDPENFLVLEKKLSRYGKNQLQGQASAFAIPLAVAEKKGTFKFYQQSISHLGGLLAINKKSKDSLGYAKKASNKGIQVSATTLDHFCAERNITSIDLLKIDCQGYEVEVLRGSKCIFKKTSCCSVEVSFYDFYEKSSSLLHIEKIMDSVGLKLWDISKLSKNPKNLRTDWAELVYTKNPSC